MTQVEIKTYFFDDKIDDFSIIHLLSMNKIPLSEESFTHLTKSVSETDHDFRCALTGWFCHYQNEFMAATDLYLYRNENEQIFSSLLSQIMYSPLFSYSIKIKLYKYYEEYYLNNHEGEINLP